MTTATFEPQFRTNYRPRTSNAPSRNKKDIKPRNARIVLLMSALTGILMLLLGIYLIMITATTTGNGTNRQYWRILVVNNFCKSFLDTFEDELVRWA